MLLRAVRLEILILDDVNVTAEEIAEFAREALELHLECRQVDVELLEDHEVYADASGEQAQA